MKQTNILLAISISSIISFGQENKKEQLKKIIISDLFVQAGFIKRTPPSGGLDDFKLLAPQSVLLNENFSGYSKTFGFNLKSMYSILVGIKFKEKEIYKSNPQLRLGISYYSGPILSGGLRKFERKPYDTLYSTQTGQTTYIDSLISRSYRMDYTSDQIRFDGSIIFKTNQQERFSLFTGLGITAGISINAFTDIYYDNQDRIEDRSNPSPAISYPTSNPDETFINKTNFGFSIYIPIGLDFRIGKKNKFWKQIHLFYELKPGINTTSIPELRSVTNPSFQHGLGIRVSKNN